MRDYSDYRQMKPRRISCGIERSQQSFQGVGDIPGMHTTPVARGGKNFYREAYYMAATVDLSASSSPGTVASYKNTVIRVDSDADFELQKLVFSSISPNIKIRIRTSQGEYLMPDGTDLQTIAGARFDSVGPGAGVSWFTPYILSWPYRFPASSDIIIEAADYSGSTNKLYMTMWGAKLYCGQATWQDPAYRKGQPTFRSTDREVVPANGTRVLTLNMDSDADVLITKANCVRTGAALVSVSEGARGRDWGNRATHIDNIFGSGQDSHKLSAPRFVPVNSSMTFQVQDLTGNPNTVEIVIEGIRFTKGVR